MSRLIVFLLTLGALCSLCQAVIFSRCGLVAALRKQKFPEAQLRDWVCLIEKESKRNTAVKSPKNDNGSYDFGLFQINSGPWCSLTSTPGKGCNIICNDLLLDDITKASKCAKIVYKEKKFKPWVAWRDYCRGKPLPDISSCK